ncbi:MAG: ribosomal protein S18-alanine N-acetyltransferase [Acidimicrobiales bacterium]
MQPGPAEAPAALAVQLMPMRRRHLRQVMRIESRVYPRPWSLSLFLSEMALRSSRAYYVARVGGVVVGYCGLMISAEDAHVTNIAVDPDWHRHKIATQLLLNACMVARQRGVSNLTLEVRVGNAGAQELYRKFGFVAAGVRKNYYTETNEDAIVMWARGIGEDHYLRRTAAIEAALRESGGALRESGGALREPGG